MRSLLLFFAALFIAALCLSACDRADEAEANATARPARAMVAFGGDAASGVDQSARGTGVQPLPVPSASAAPGFGDAVEVFRRGTPVEGQPAAATERELARAADLATARADLETPGRREP